MTIPTNPPKENPVVYDTAFPPTPSSGVGPMGPPGDDGNDGEDAFPIPGERGLDGASGAAGAPGSMGPPGDDGNDGEDGWPIPGERGAIGATGATGPMGPPGMDGEVDGFHDELALARFVAGALWAMRKSSSQTLTASTPQTITFDTTVIDDGYGCIDLTNDQFIVPCTGRYFAILAWAWESTVPGAYELNALINGSHAWMMQRPETSGVFRAFGTTIHVVPLALTLGDLVTMSINPGTPVGVTARGNAAINLSTCFALALIRPLAVRPL